MVVMDQDVLTKAGIADPFSSDAFAYLDVELPENAATKVFLQIAYQQLAMAAGLDEMTAKARMADVVKGTVALVYVNAVLDKIGLPPIDAKGLPRGIAWVHMGKRDLFSSTGSRYVVIKDTYDAYAAYKFAGGTGEDAYGKDQTAWLDGALATPGVAGDIHA
jgi:alkaline phosphatase D